MKNYFSNYNPQSIGVVTRILGAHNFGNESYSDHKDFAYSSTILEFYTQERRGIAEYSPYFQLRFSTPFSKSQDIGTFINEFRWGFLFGGSHRIFNKINKETGKGWLMFLNGGLTLDLTTSQRYSEMNGWSFNTPANLGGKISFCTSYNFSRFSAVTFGLDFGYMVGFSWINNKKDPIWEEFTELGNQLLLDQVIVYGVSLGVSILEKSNPYHVGWCNFIIYPRSFGNSSYRS